MALGVDVDVEKSPGVAVIPAEMATCVTITAGVAVAAEMATGVVFIAAELAAGGAVDLGKASGVTVIVAERAAGITIADETTAIVAAVA
jgi:hypothetical protein